jgi:hypothetical protein
MATQVRVRHTAPHLRVNTARQVTHHPLLLSRTGTPRLQHKPLTAAVHPIHNRMANPRRRPEIMALHPPRATLLPHLATLGMEQLGMEHHPRPRLRPPHFLLGGPSIGTDTVAVLTMLRSRVGGQNGYCPALGVVLL